MWNWRSRTGEGMNEEAGVPEVQSLLRDLKLRQVQPGPFFTKRVMAAIEAREVELTRRSRAWAAIPVFASRLSVVAALLIMMAGTWLYTGSHRAATQGGIFEDSAAAASANTQDDVFVVPAEEAR